MANFMVDFYYSKNNVRNRRQQQGSSVVHLHGAESEFAVQSYLDRLYPDARISINKISWR